MKNLLKIVGIIAVVAMIGFTMASCATNSSIGGAEGPHGFFTGNGATNALVDGATEIGSYSVILGWFDAGYPDYAAAVKKAEDSGKKITSVTKWYFGFLTKTTAYAR